MLRRVAGIGGAFLQRRNNSSFLKEIGGSVSKLPMREAVRYTKKNMKWTSGDVDAFTTSHANGLHDFDIVSGDTVAVWMNDCAEKHTTMLSAAKLGVRIAELDHNVTEIGHIRDFLKLSKCKMIVFHPTTETADYLLLLRKAIPEFFDYDDSKGQHFHSKHFPSLKLFVHTGFDVEMGAYCFKGIFVPHPTNCAVAAAAPTVNDDTVAYFKASKGDGKLSVGPILSHKELLSDPNWLFAKNLVAMKYFEIHD